MAEIDLAVLLRTMEPTLQPKPCGFAVSGVVLAFRPFATLVEDKGLTVSAFLSSLGGESVGSGSA